MRQPTWAKFYPPGVNWNAELPQTHLISLLDDAVRRWPARPAVSYMGRTLTYRELSALVDRAAVGLRALGVAPGVRVGLYLPNVPQYVIAFFGILRAGATVVNYSPLDAIAVIEHKIEDSETDVLVTIDAASLYPAMRDLAQRTRLRKLVVGTLGEFSAQPDQVRAQMQASGQLAAIDGDENAMTFAALLDNDGQYVAPLATDARTNVAVLQYTGGTTGLPKGAVLTHASLSAATAQAHAIAMGDDLLQEGAERSLVALPLFHVYAMVVNLLLGIRIGAELVLMVRFDAAAILQEISSRSISHFPGVPTMFTALCCHPEVSRFDLRSLKVCNSGGAPLPVELLRQFHQLTGCTLSEGWGMTETSSTGTFTPNHIDPRPGSCGIPMPGVDIRLLDVDNAAHAAKPGEPGEIAVRGPNVMAGYWKKPDETADSFTADGFFRTGDVGYLDEDGYLYIIDRTKDMLLCGGFNVYPRVIEEAIYSHPSVEEVMVIGIPDPYRGQSPKAYIKLRQGHDAFSLDELKEFLKPYLGKHEMVYALEFRTDLPKTAVGKLSKKMLLDEVQA